MKYFELAIMCHAINYVNYEIIMGNVILRKTHQQGGIFIWLKLLVEFRFHIKVMRLHIILLGCKVWE